MIAVTVAALLTELSSHEIAVFITNHICSTMATADLIESKMAASLALSACSRIVR